MIRRAAGIVAVMVLGWAGMKFGGIETASQLWWVLFVMFGESGLFLAAYRWLNNKNLKRLRSEVDEAAEA